MSATVRKVVAAMLLLLGVQLWLVVGRGDWGNLPPPIVWPILLLLALVPAVNRRIGMVLDRLSQPSPGMRLLVSVVVALVAGAYLYATAVQQKRDFFLKILDEHSYAIQARMLASGRLWMPAHAAADSFDSPYILVRPVCASMYFPGTALTLLPAVWLGLPWWVTPLALSAASVGLLYRVVAELTDGVGGLLAAMMLLSLSVFRELSLRLYSQTPMLFLSLCLIWAWLAWRRERRWTRTILIGLIAGWMLIVRPLDAMVFLIPLLVAMALDLKRFALRTLAALAIGVLPFVTVQLIVNRGITGSWLTTPHAFYASRNYPGVTLGFHEPLPVSTLATIVPQKRALYEEAIPAIERHRPETVLHEAVQRRLPLTASATLPNNLLLVLFPIGIAALFDARRSREHAWVVVSPLLLFVVAYAFYLFYFAHYLLVVAPAVIIFIVLAARALPDYWPRAKNALAALLTLWILIQSFFALPPLDRNARDDVSAGDLGAINDLLAHLPHRPAIVLFRYQDGVNPHREPVYNTATASIDDAIVIRAHDLPGEPNRKLLDYFAAHQPQRHVYRVSRQPEALPSMEYLGPVPAVSQSMKQPL